MAAPSYCHVCGLTEMRRNVEDEEEAVVTKPS